MQKITVILSGDDNSYADMLVNAQELDAILRLRDSLVDDGPWAPGFRIEDEQGRDL